MRTAIAAACAFVTLLLSGPAPTPGQPKQKKDPHVAQTDPLSPEQQRKAFRLPPGFEIQLVASEPDIRKPINIAFDAAGRLWVTQSVEYPFPVKDGAPSRDAVKVLEDFAPDGRAQKITTFADNLNIPIGVLPIGDGAIVHSIPNISRLRDTKGTGKADRREVLYGTYGHADTHGMTGEFMWGFDGWIYACHGFANKSTVKAKDGSEISMHSGNTYRIKPDGSRVEQWTWGQVNPFGLAFDPMGNLYSCDCHSRPLYQLLRGAYYPSFGKPHDGLGFGPEMVTHDHGSTAIAGIAYYAATQFPPEFRDNLFIGNVVTNRINRDRLERHGSTYQGIAMPDLVAIDDPWFRPVDIKLGPDGALYVADFYTRIIGHYEVPLKHPQRTNEHGRIWRIVYRGKANEAPAPKSEDLSRATVDRLVAALADDNLAVRLSATHQLVERGGREVTDKVGRVFAAKEASAVQKAHSLWVLERLRALDASLLSDSVKDKEALVRVHAMRILAERGSLTEAERRLAVAGLKDKDAFVQRCAAEALGQHPHTGNLRPLLDLRHAVPAADTHLLHMVRMALRNQLKDGKAFADIRARHKAKEWDQKDFRALADVCTGVPRSEAAHFLVSFMGQTNEDRPALERYVRHAARYAEATGYDKVLVFRIRERFPDDLAAQAALLKAGLQGTQERTTKPRKMITEAASELAVQLFDSGKAPLVKAGIELATLLKGAAMHERLAALASNPKVAQDQRRAAAAAMPGVDAARSIEPLAKLLTDAAEAFPLREQAANSLGAVNQPAAHAALVKALATVPARLETTVAAALAGSGPGAEKLLEAVGQGKASARLLLERAVEVKLNQSKVPELAKRVAALTKGLPSADARLQELLGRRRDAFAKAKPNVVLGAKAFEKHCGACHQLANKGAKVGPQLDGIGVRGLDRILEDILDPNRNVDQAFRSTLLQLKDGQLVNGLLLREEGNVLVLIDGQGKEQRISGGDVEQRRVVPTSPMPANLAEQIPDGEFADLLAYLLAQRPKDDPRGR